jgi:23S rRNA (cytidine1920-2'-O)/16S rRNA (cytidine1409-2'-O)-methyltransferase
LESKKAVNLQKTSLIEPAISFRRMIGTIICVLLPSTFWNVKNKIRIDQLLVKRGLLESRETAQRLILARKILVNGLPAEKASQNVAEDASIEVIEGLKYVSRGGLKLEAALDAFGIDVKDRIAIDIGASTGGFTDCLLQRGAKRIYAVDVGYGQLAWKLREDKRVNVIERTNARYLTVEQFTDPIDIAVIDVSFISALKILEPLSNITSETVVLLKPQFEAGPDDVPRGGVIRDPAVHRKVLRTFWEKLQNWKVRGVIESPIQGASGNREFLVHLKGSNSEGLSEEQFEKRIEELTK